VQVNPFRKAAIHLEWLKMRAFERRAIAQFDHVAAVSAEDARILKSFGARSVEVIPNGVDVEYYEPTNGRDDRQILVYCASMDAFVNQDAAMYFAKSILPKIHEKKPQTKFMIVGRSPSVSIRNLAGDRIIVTGSVEDVRPLLGRASVSVVPFKSINSPVRSSPAKAFWTFSWVAEPIKIAARAGMANPAPIKATTIMITNFFICFWLLITLLSG